MIIDIICVVKTRDILVLFCKTKLKSSDPMYIKT